MSADRMPSSSLVAALARRGSFRSAAAAIGDQPVLQIASTNDVVVSREEWDELHAEMRRYRGLFSGGQIDRIIATAAKVFGVTVEDLLSQKREYPLPDVRRAVFLVGRSHDIHNQVILRALGRHRSLETKYARQIANLLEVDKEFARLVKRLEDACA